MQSGQGGNSTAWNLRGLLSPKAVAVKYLWQRPSDCGVLYPGGQQFGQNEGKMPNTATRLIALAALALILALAVEGILRPRGLTLDFANFYDAGQKARAGEFAGLYDPMALIAGQPPFGNMSFFSAPLTSYFYVPVSLNSSDASPGGNIAIGA